MSNTLIYIAIVVAVAAMTSIIAYSTENQKNYVPEDAVLSQAVEQGLLPKTGMLRANLNKEQWHEDPFGDIAQKVREQNGR